MPDQPGHSQYLREELDEADRYRIENHLLDCPLCSDAVEGYANLHNFEEDGQLDTLQQAFPTASPPLEVVKKPTVTRRRLFPAVAAAASVLLLISAIWLYWQSGTSERLYQAYHESFLPENLAAIRSVEENTNTNAFKEGLEAYQQGAYLQSIPLLEDHLMAHSEDVQATLLLGLAYLENGQALEAAEKLEIVRLNSTDYYEDASWYASLAHIKAGQLEEAREILMDLQRLEDGYYKEEVKTILNKLPKKE